MIVVILSSSQSHKHVVTSRLLYPNASCIIILFIILYSCFFIFFLKNICEPDNEIHQWSLYSYYTEYVLHDIQKYPLSVTHFDPLLDS